MHSSTNLARHRRPCAITTSRKSGRRCLMHLVFLLCAVLLLRPHFSKAIKPNPPPPPPRPTSSISKRSLQERRDREGDDAFGKATATKDLDISELDDTLSSDQDEKTDESSSHLNTTVVQLTETEIWDGTRWRAPSGLGSKEDDSMRWTDEDGKACAPPVKQKPGPNAEWEGDWKILTRTSTRDSYGWEYIQSTPYHRRERIWLRTIVHLPTKSKPSSSSRKRGKGLKKTSTKKKSQSSLLSRRKLPRIIRDVMDDFNFKGYGFSIWKSFVFPKSIGVGFKIPLTPNFNSWDSNPGLPTCNLLIGLFYPFTAAVILSTSMRLAYIKYATWYCYDMVCYSLLTIFWTVYRGLILAASAMVFPITRTLVNPPMPRPPTWQIAKEPIFQQDLSESVGCSLAYRYTPEEGFYWTCRGWQCYVPTLASLWRKVDSIISGAVNFPRVPGWVTRHSVGTGFEYVGPLSMEPWVSASAVLGLSGFYFRPDRANMKQSTSVIAEDVTTEDGSEEDAKRLQREKVKGTKAQARAA